MNRKRALTILRDVLSLPTAPFVEHHVVEFIRAFAASRGCACSFVPLDQSPSASRGGGRTDGIQSLTVGKAGAPSGTLRVDAVGNILIHYRKGRQSIGRPICLAAHMDHPGFAADRMVSAKQVRAVWRGGVLAEYFSGEKVRFHTDGRWVRGKVSSVVTGKRGGRTVVKTAIIDVPGPIAKGSPGMWDFPEPAVRNNRIYARACDDLAGAAAMLACLDDLVRRRASGEAYFLFTRAEEVGFIGAMAACKLKTIPQRCVVIAVENSSELRDARMGDGPILRVGDRATTFTSPATSFCADVAKDLAARNKSFTYQRKLMDGGMCESSAYCELGCEATGICIALGNYHNMNARRKKLGPEYVNLDDYVNLTRWFIALSTTKRRYTGRDADLLARLDRLQKEYNPLLKRTAPPLRPSGTSHSSYAKPLCPRS